LVNVPTEVNDDAVTLADSVDPVRKLAEADNTVISDVPSKGIPLMVRATANLFAALAVPNKGPIKLVAVTLPVTFSELSSPKLVIAG